jgi:hypothetical protein
MKALTAHISFHFRPDRLASLRGVMGAIFRILGLRSQGRLGAHEWFDGLPANATVVAHDMTGLHRKQLAWLRSSADEGVLIVERVEQLRALATSRA